MSYRGIIKDTAMIYKIMQNQKTFDRVLDKIKIISFGDGKCVAELKIEEQHANPLGSLHGGLSTTLVDCISALALASKVPGDHVSVDINMSFLKGAHVGDEIVIDSGVVRSGKNLSFLEVVIKNKNTGDVLVKGSHTKLMLKT